MSKKLVVIGNGMAGVAAIEAILKKGADVSITLFGDEPHPNDNSFVAGGLASRRDSFHEGDRQWQTGSSI